MKTVKELIADLQKLAEQYGDDIPVCVYDETAADDWGWNGKYGDLYLTAKAEIYEPEKYEVADGAPSKCIMIG